jgi:putative molybdopterin biosynthesis protein
LDHELHLDGIDSRAIPGYSLQVSMHTEAASLIHSGRADAALGLQASAHEFGLDFIPLFEERYDLVLPTRSEKMLAPFLDFIQTGAFRSGVNAMTGYSTAHSGELIPL